MYEAAGNPLSVTITVPLDATGELLLIAAAGDNIGNAALSPPRGLVVDPGANITAVNIPERDSIRLDATVPTRTLRPVASFVDGRTRAIVGGKYENYGAPRSLAFTSSDPTVVRVTAKGQLVAQKAGSAVITIAATNGAPTNATVVVAGSAVTACNDGIDNDGDGAIDTADAGCATAAGLTELTGLTACNDGLDNDFDGKIDMADVQCTSATVNFEHQPPAPGFTVSCSGLTCTLTGRALAPRPIATYAWSFGDGANPIGESVTRTFAGYGAYPVTLTAVDSDGQSGVATGVVVVDGALPVARFTFTCSGLTCTFDGSSSTDDVGLAAYAWDFGDGTTATGVNASRTYSTAGSRTVTLTVTDRANKIDDEKKYVITSSAPASVPLRYVALAPCRIYDSRTAPNTKLDSGTERILNVASTPCGTASAIRAVSLAMVILEPTGDGFLRMYAPGAPTDIPAMNFTPAAAPRAGNAIVPVAADGTIAIKPFVTGTSGATHVILDIQGFFVDQPAAPSLGFASLTPCRLLDTRLDAAPDGQLRPINSGETRELLVQGSPKNCGVPAGAHAVAANLTAIAMTNGGHLKLFPAGMALPGTSNVNYKADRAAIGSSARSTLAALPRPTDLAVHASLPSGGSVHAAVDVSGYFSASAPLRYYPIAPCRAFDTRLALQAPRFAHNETRALQIRGNCGVPADAKSAMVSLTVVSPTT
ncbi:MAG TPA: PKD domain-containing protein, partial [Thermoanaerobaculia bacterium]